MEKTVTYWLTNVGGEEFAGKFGFPVTLIAVVFVAWVAYELFRRIVSPVIICLADKTHTEWDDDLLTPEVLRAFSQMMPAIVVAWLLPKMFVSHEILYIWIKKLTMFYIVWSCVHFINKVVEAIFHAFDKRDYGKVHSFKGTFQMLKLIVIGVGVIAGAGILFDRSPIAILTAFGASAAVLMLVFKDTILGLVAGVQLTANKMLQKGDWIICQKAGANGEVIDISLTTVKVRNWDNSVITIPPYNLISDSFQNYQPMRASGGRRVSRFVYIDVNSVRFLGREELESLAGENIISGEEISCGEKVVNLGLFRRHMEKWLRSRKEIIVKKGRTMFVMVRQLQPTPQGIPLELYFFTNKTGWADYEEIQSEIFDYVYAIIGKFGLKIYQAPSGLDLCRLDLSGNMKTV
ncbi:MAG: mechanosensitive ion channel family protein [Muribaculaceae bacterium]|nr:mechanosensitive ion channel family protein [Muribaculaceae bacterium]